MQDVEALYATPIAGQRLTLTILLQKQVCPLWLQCGHSARGFHSAAVGWGQVPVQAIIEDGTKCRRMTDCDTTSPAYIDDAFHRVSFTSVQLSKSPLSGRNAQITVLCGTVNVSPEFSLMIFVAEIHPDPDVARGY